ncbi:MAG TPA: hypothetical protein PKC83_15415 [Gemmatimonadaceae bacterium]|nr:hypothetical protein [Gemmatimonadaceae bacterium]
MVSRVIVQVDTTAAFVGMRRTVVVFAFDAKGAPMNSGDAMVTISDPGAAAVASRSVFPVVVGATGRRFTELQLSLQLIGEGEVSIEASVGAASGQAVLHIRPQPPITTALVIDSFTVVEYHATCAWDCPYLYYAPLLKLREPTGSAWATVEGVEITIPGKTTGMCRGSVPYRPGQSLYVSYVDPYPWSNDLFFVSLDGKPVPDGLATARVIVRDVRGAYGTIEASAPIQRMVKDPVFPAPSEAAPFGWECHYGN